MSCPSCPHMGQMITTMARKHNGIGRKVVRGSLPPSGTQRSSTTTSCSDMLWMTTMGRDILQSVLRLCGQPRYGQIGSHFPPLHHRSELFLGGIPLDEPKKWKYVGVSKVTCFRTIENVYVEQEESALHHRSTRVQEGIGNGLLSLPLFKIFCGMRVVSSMSKYPQKCNYCKREVCTYCRCTPGVHLCSHCLADHIQDVNNA